MRSKAPRTSSPEVRLESARLVIDENYSIREAAMPAEHQRAKESEKHIRDIEEQKLIGAEMPPRLPAEQLGIGRSTAYRIVQTAQS